MKKLAAASATAILTLALLASCANNSGPSAPDTSKPAGSTPVTNEQTTDTPLTTAPVTTAPVTTDAPADTEAEPTQTLTLNEDMLAYYGMTFNELQAKYGEIIDCCFISGGLSFYFENGYGWYSFYAEDARQPEEWLKTGEGDHKTLLPKDDAICYIIDDVGAESLFAQPFDTLDLSEVADIDGVELVGSYDYDGGSRFKYATEFSYDGFENEKTEIIIKHDEKDFITPDSMFRIFLHRDYVKE